MRERPVRIAAVYLQADCPTLRELALQEGWQIDIAEDLGQLIQMLAEGRHHLALIAAREPQDLPRSQILALLGRQLDLPVVLLVPHPNQARRMPNLLSLASQQVQDLQMPADAFGNMLRMQIRSSRQNEPLYTIMCVDDDTDFLRSMEAFLPRRLEECLPRMNLDFVFIDTPAEAIETAIALRDQLALIISDQMMPGLKGTEMLDRIAASCPQVQRVLLTGQADMNSAVDAINHRILDKYFFKPIEEPVDFVNSLAMLLRQHHLGRHETQQSQRMLAQLDLLRSASQAQDMGAALSLIETFVEESFAPRAMLLAKQTDGQLVVKFSRGLAGLQAQSILPAHGLCQQISANGTSLWVASEAELPAGMARASFEEFPLAACPLLWQDSVLGLLMITTDHRLSTDQQRLLGFVADTASLLLGGLSERKMTEDSYIGTMASLMDAMEAKDVFTRGHTERVTQYAVMLAQAAGMGAADLEVLRRAASLHDIGKIGVPDRVISKAGRLDEEETRLMRQHAEIGGRLLGHLQFLGAARHIVRHHHEHHDGQGYPDGLAGEEIPLGARILAIANAFDVMTSARPFRQAMSVPQAVNEIIAEAGRQFDPRLVVLFLEAMDKQGIIHKDPSAAGQTAAWSKA